jgi:hypothetical protein
MCARVYAITAALRLRCGQSASVDSLFMWFCYLAGNLTSGLQIHAQNILGDVDVGVWSNCNIRNVIIIIVTFFSFFYCYYLLLLFIPAPNISLQVSWGRMLDKKRVLLLESQVKHPNFQTASGSRTVAHLTRHRARIPSLAAENSEI